MALPIAPACSAPQGCGRAESRASRTGRSEESAEMRRPFSALKDLLKKT
jgi:uncharacterized metal-binding protein YceD (DUF177 family)